MKSTRKKTRRFAAGGYDLDPLVQLPTLKPRAITSAPIDATNELTMAKANTAPIPVQQTTYQIPQINFSNLYTAPSTQSAGNGYQGMKQQYGQDIINEAKTNSGLLKTAGSAFGPIGSAIGSFAGFALDATAQNKAARMQNTTVGWSPGQAQEAESWFRNYNSGGTISSNNKSRDRIKPGDFPHNTTVTQFDWVNRGFANDGIQEESGKRILRKGDTGEEVRQLQNFLKNKGHYKGDVDGIYGPLTEAAVKGYQK